MDLLLLEALGALLLLAGIVWWTMFADRENGELKQNDKLKSQDEINREKS
tara:strand:- start:688 stop:837 length:150 start_codon:yes stop_codon:yes gene_type:complete